MKLKTPRGMRLHIGIFGRRNVGKSSLLNAITDQDASIVSETAGTTTDPVEKPMELLPLGPVLFIDTAGIDDIGALGAQRIEKTRQIFDRADLGVIVTTAGAWGEFEASTLDALTQRGVPVIAVVNKTDLERPAPAFIQTLSGSVSRVIQSDLVRKEGVLAFRQAIFDCAPPAFFENRPIIGDVIAPGGMAVLVVPIDKEAPKGRLILPQVQTIRDILDHHLCCAVTTEHELRATLSRLNPPADIVVTDSQAFDSVSRIVPPEIPLTGFSILFARYKGDLAAMALNATAIDTLKPGDHVLVEEACTHHPLEDDIARHKIPQWLNSRAGGALQYEYARGHDFPDDLSPYKMIIHCGACMLNRREVLNRLLKARAAGVPMTNYGLVIAYCLNLFERALSPFPEILSMYRARARRAAEQKPAPTA